MAITFDDSVDTIARNQLGEVFSKWEEGDLFVSNTIKPKAKGLIRKVFECPNRHKIIDMGERFLPISRHSIYVCHLWYCPECKQSFLHYELDLV